MENIVRIILVIALFIISSFYTNASDKVTTVLLSIDGLSNQQLAKIKPRTLTLLAENGLSSEGLLPVFPTKTFPNHLSIVTGAYPAQHGLIHNNFYDKQKNKFYKMGEGSNDPTWVKLKPIWVLAEEQGLKAASYFWPESDAELFGVRPSYYFPYQHNTPNKTRINQIVKWLELPDNQRPQFISSYFSIVDSANHDFGTFSEQAVNAVAEIDDLIASFLSQLQQKNININLVIVSDHGMEYIKRQVPQYTIIPKDTYHMFKVVNGQTQIMLYGKNNTKLKKLKRRLKKQAKGRYNVFGKSEFPEHWQLSSDVELSYVPDLIINAKPGVVFNKDSSAATHGFDLAESEEMEAIFIAIGPDIKKGKLEKFENVHVFSLLTHLIGVEHKDNRPTDLTIFKPFIH